MKTQELSGAMLDYWVGVADGLLVEIRSGICFREVSNGKHRFDPSENWLLGGPIIERERIKVIPQTIGEKKWLAAIQMNGSLQWNDAEFGPTPLIAAMRAFVAAKFGEEVPATHPEQTEDQ